MSTAIAPASSSSVLGSSLSGSNSSSTANSLFGATSGTSSSNGSASNSLDALSQQVAAMDQAAQQAKINVKDFQKNSNDVQIDNRMTARNVGILRQNYSRLNVFSSLDKNDDADFFTFNVATSGPTKFGVLTDNAENPDVRFQLIDKSGNTIADSSSDAGSANDVYKQLVNGTYNLQAGKYVLRVTRENDTQANRQNAYNYAVQLSQGLYKNDYDTVEKAVDKNADPFGLGANSSLDTLTSSLAGAVTTLQNLPPIGTSASDKLTGVLTSLIS